MTFLEYSEVTKSFIADGGPYYFTAVKDFFNLPDIMNSMRFTEAFCKSVPSAKSVFAISVMRVLFSGPTTYAEIPEDRSVYSFASV